MRHGTPTLAGGRMSIMKHLAVILTCAALVTTPAAAAHPVWDYGSMANAGLGDGADLHGAVPFPADNAWNKDIAKAPVDPDSANLIASIGLSTGLHPVFGSGTYDSRIIGIPYVVVSSAQASVPI